MEELRTYTCASCKKEFQATAASEIFCVYCGSKQPAAEPAAPGGEDRLRVLEAYKSGDYERVLRETYEGVMEKDPLLGLCRLAALYFTKREAYLAEARELRGKQGVKSALSSLFTSRNEYAESPIHMGFFNETERIMLEVAERLSFGDMGAEGEETALRLARSLLVKKSEKELGALYWPLLAIEHRCLPLLPYIERGALGELYKEYKGYYKRYQRVPNQERVLAAMKEELGLK
ncbi:MAG: hypothetical protein Q4B42_02205 [Oscillospiraceae bacterium]|nr:hypothetical protein [Oscillospiraceae bacterium]